MSRNADRNRSSKDTIKMRPSSRPLKPVLEKMAPIPLKEYKVGIFRRMHWELVRRNAKFWIGAIIGVAGIFIPGPGGRLIEQAGYKISGINETQKKEVRKEATKMKYGFWDFLKKAIEFILSLFKEKGNV